MQNDFGGRSRLDVGLRFGRALSFYRRQSANFKVLNLRTTLGSFLGNLTAPYNQVFAKELGASPIQLGFLSSLGSAFAASLALPAGFLADRCGRKKLYLIGSACGLLTPIFYIFAGSWVWLVPAYIFSKVTITLREPAYQAMYAGSVRRRDRGSAFGLAKMLTSIPVLLAPIAAVLIMGRPSKISPSVVRPLYAIQLAGLLALWVFVWLFLREDDGGWTSLRSAFGHRDPLFLLPLAVLPIGACLLMGWGKGMGVAALAPLICMLGLMVLLVATPLRRRFTAARRDGLGGEVRAILRMPGVKAWLAMKGLGAAAMGLAEPFWLVYAAFVVGVSPTGLALMVTLRTLGQLVSAVPWGLAADRRGRKFTLLVGRLFRHVGILCFILGREPWLLVLGYALMGIGDASTSVWTVIRMELVPSKWRAAMASMDRYVWYLPVIFTAMLGGLIYSQWPRMIFILCLVIDLGVRMPLVAFWVPETRKKSPTS